MDKSFHCDFCGEKVHVHADQCPHCGRFFKAVKCPVCAYTGRGKEFLNGCPTCGYLKNVKRNAGEDDRKNNGKPFQISRVFAYVSICFLSIILIYFIYLLIKK